MKNAKKKAQPATLRNLAPATPRSKPVDDSPPFGLYPETFALTAPKPMTPADALLREKLALLCAAEDSERSAEADYSEAVRLVVEAQQAADKAGGVRSQRTRERMAAAAEAGQALGARVSEAFEFNGRIFIAHPFSQEFSSYSKPVVLS